MRQGDEEEALVEGGERDGEADAEYTDPEPWDEESASYDEAGALTEAPSTSGETVAGRAVADGGPDVYLDVPVLKVDEIDLDVEDLRARVSLQAEVLDLLKLNVGADVTLGRVHLGISGVEAQAQLKVRLDNVAMIIDRVLTTLDRNPELLHELARGVGSAVRDVGGGARHAVGELGAGTGRAVHDVGRAAGSAVQDVGRGVGAVAEDVGEGAGAAVQEVGRGVGSATEDLGEGAGAAVQDVGRGARRAVEDVGGEAGPAVVKAGRKVGYATGSVAEKPAEAAGTTGGAAEGDPTGDTVRKGARTAAGTTSKAAGTKRPARSEGRGAARKPADGDRDAPARSPSGTRTRRVRDEDGKLPPRPGRRRTSDGREEPP
ncbi:hypothetical protein SAMN05428944_7711 [Streptomyces sp. 1222.5]|uniref:hypothetical protein n=1 Tax=unclassified Streptomyces TaxID=2593676 RepID=UPI00089C3357|nr:MULTISPECIES: hypothetical protein [unclassified Streptomyces]PKW05283.1 hypothetical protein BX260_0372 [Streptomyces sp. 5112.2]SED44752.1 hypothetical protein SAMN05428944_7711 [Streptomyces sp. 1222.5]